MSHRILVIEDNVDNMDLIEELLEDEGYEILKAFLALDGLNLLKSERVDMVLMDISLPDLNGLEATKRIKGDEKTKSIPVIALTAHAMGSYEQEALEAGCDGFLTKPIDESKLFETLNAFLKGE